MLAGVIVGISSNLTWLAWGLTNVRSRPYAWKIMACVVLISTAMSLELLDFAPLWGTLDAHALWHAATIPLVYMYYDFLVNDAQFEVRIGKGKQAVRALGSLNGK
ncbi:Post-GPI attachment to proteins factor 3 [Borealophlyctis nickersoniae]|nr:Post-GPI attachment to proteins factor 3 [Borealophlyctis nickersoniae]